MGKKDKDTKKTKEKKQRRSFLPESVSVTFVWLVILGCGILLAVLGVVWAFIYHLQVTSNEVSEDTVVTGGMQTINRDELADAIEIINERDAAYQRHITQTPQIPEPRSSTQRTNESEEEVLDGPISSE